MQAPNKILMRRPVNFSFNEETAGSNSFQNLSNSENIGIKVIKEWENAKMNIESYGITVLSEFPDNSEFTPDEIFPNNWFSVQPKGELIIYPMEAKNRRLEKNPFVLSWLKENLPITNTLDLSSFENENKFLEGTGSIVFDHDNKNAYCCESTRSNIFLFEQLCDYLDYKPVSFLSLDLAGLPVYHTNVMMSVGTNYIVICLESIENIMERSMIKSIIQNSRKTLIDISLKQMNSFCGNIIELSNNQGELYTIMSSKSFENFTENQKDIIENKSRIISCEIPTIENIGGGGIRCMIAGLHL